MLIRTESIRNARRYGVMAAVLARKGSAATRFWAVLAVRECKAALTPPAHYRPQDYERLALALGQVEGLPQHPEEWWPRCFPRDGTGWAEW